MAQVARVGLDTGNSEATLAFTAQRKKVDTITIPSYIGTGSLQKLRTMRRGRGAQPGESTRNGEYVLVHHGHEQYVGALALGQADDATSARGDIGRYWSGHTLKLLLTLCGIAFAPKQQHLFVTTGLPVQVWSEENEVRVRRSLIGKHSYQFNGEKREIVVEGVLVMMEGAGALAKLGTDQPIRQGVVDIGGRTSILYMATGQDPLLPQCDGTPIGVESVGDRLSQRFHELHGRPLGRWELRQLLYAYKEQRDHGIKPKDMKLPGVYVSRRQVSITHWLLEAIDAVGGDISTFIRTTWRTSEQGAVALEAAKVYLIGGGAYYFEPFVTQAAGEIVISKTPELENALGYKAVGDQLTDADWQQLR